jgi:hypothetical protein
MKLPITPTTPIWGIHDGKTGNTASLLPAMNRMDRGRHYMADPSNFKHKTYHV